MVYLSTFTETHAGSYGSSWHLIFVVDGPMALESKVAEKSQKMGYMPIFLI